MKMKASVLCTVVALAILTGCGEPDKPVTRGDVADRNAAREVERCTKQYLKASNPEPDSEYWIMCLHVSSELANRDKIKVAQQVIRSQGKNVFESDQASTELSQKLIDRINRE
ncbi:MAG TPA: hypothetical protein VJY83_00295 [Thiopseudomonas sp.]|nr:hypothetical protein [Thiopseudomonas sp.]